MKQIDPHIQRIISWRESFATLPDTHFFELIRMYLGEVHTPYNKPKLIEELGAFLRKEENRRTLVSLLSESDVQLICAVHFIQNATQEKVAQFFAGEYSFATVYERLLNLEERLIVYRHGDKQTGKTIISLNPMLEDVLAPFISRSVLLVPPTLAETNQSVADGLSPELLAAFISFLYATPDVCKADGSFKKRTVAALETLFPDKTELLHCVTLGFLNLSILKEDDTGFVLDRSKLDQFAALDEITQYTLLCVASQGRFSRSGLVRQAQLLLSVAEEIGVAGCTRTGLLRMAFLISEKDNDIPGIAPIGQTSRFASMLSRSRENDVFAGGDVVSMMDRLIDIAVLTGIFSEKGRTADGETVFVQGSALTSVPRPKEPPFPKVLNIDAGFSVTLLPGLPLCALIPLVQCMDLVQYDTAAQFEISKKSVMHAFDAGMNWRQIGDMLENNSPYNLPQNLRVSLEDWGNAYSSATLYKGYVLQVNTENASALEHNPAISRHIAATLAPGIYLLDVESDIQAKGLIAQSNIDFIGKIKSAEKPQVSAGFPDLCFEKKTTVVQNRNDNTQDNAWQNPQPPSPFSSESDRNAHFSAMRSELEKLNLLPEQKEGLLDRIERKIVLNPVQLRGDSVRLERIEASGMDFSGKVHVIESAISSDNMVELEYENPNDPEGDGVVIVGNPLGTEKLDGDALIRIELIPQHEEKLFSIGKARLVRRIRGSVLK